MIFLSKIRENIFKIFLKMRKVKFGENVRFTYPFVSISSPYNTVEFGSNILFSGGGKAYNS